HRGEELVVAGRARGEHVEDRRGPDLLLQAARPVGRRRGEHDRQRLLQASVPEPTDGVRGRGTEAAGREFGGERGGIVEPRAEGLDLGSSGSDQMPHNELCPACRCLVSDWHWEWHAEPGYSEIYRGIAGMECPSCGAVVMYTGATVPLTVCPHGSQVR